jgi:hypothetical protein
VTSSTSCGVEYLSIVSFVRGYFTNTPVHIHQRVHTFFHNIGSVRPSFLDYIPPRDAPRSRQLTASNTYQWAAYRCAEPFVLRWIESWKALLAAPYRGISAGGRVDTKVHRLATQGQDLGAPVHLIVGAAKKVLSLASPSKLAAVKYPLDADEWRSWINPEIYVFQHGVSLEEVSSRLIVVVHDLLRASLSLSGYAKARSCMMMNGFSEQDCPRGESTQRKFLQLCHLLNSVHRRAVGMATF